MSTTPNPVTMIDPSGQARAVPADAVAQAPPDWKPATKMIDPQGTPRWIPSEAVDQARQANYAVHPDNPGVQKMVSPKGQVTYALPSEVSGFKQSGHTLINPDGSFALQNIFGEDPLKEQERYQLVRKALTPTEKSGANKAELIDAAKTGAEAAIDTASGASGAAAAPEVAAAAEPAIARTIFALGPPAARALSTAVRLVKTPAVKYALGGGGTVTGGELLASYIKKKLGL